MTYFEKIAKRLRENAEKEYFYLADTDEELYAKLPNCQIIQEGTTICFTIDEYKNNKFFEHLSIGKNGNLNKEALVQAVFPMGDIEIADGGNCIHYRRLK